MLRNLRAFSLATVKKAFHWKVLVARLISSLIIIVILFVCPKATKADTTPTSTTNPNVVVIDKISIDINDPAWDEYNWQINHGAPGIPYWNRVAKCETNRDWKDHGTWAGGLGIFTAKRFAQNGSGTWERYGGEQFALRPQGATPLQQIVVANRIAMFGYRVTYRDWDGITERVIQKTQYKKPSGFNGWGCIRQHRHGRTKGKWHINLNPTRFENNRLKYWRNHEAPYMTHEVVLHKMNIPRWALNKYPNDPKRFK